MNRQYVLNFATFPPSFCCWLFLVSERDKMTLTIDIKATPCGIYIKQKERNTCMA
jgi:hypothetical protein